MSLLLLRVAVEQQTKTLGFRLPADSSFLNEIKARLVFVNTTIPVSLNVDFLTCLEPLNQKQWQRCFERISPPARNLTWSLISLPWGEQRTADRKVLWRHSLILVEFPHSHSGRLSLLKSFRPRGVFGESRSWMSQCSTGWWSLRSDITHLQNAFDVWGQWFKVWGSVPPQGAYTCMKSLKVVIKKQKPVKLFGPFSNLCLINIFCSLV